MIFYTIGVYNSNEEDFFNKLISEKIDVFCDIRQRRGVRGAKYSFVNSKKLQRKLNDLGIRYIHNRELAPTKEIRNLQKQADLNNQEFKRERKALGKVFIKEYENRIITAFNFNEFIDNLNILNAKKIVLFCVEEKHQACHRSLVTNVLSSDYQYEIIHL